MNATAMIKSKEKSIGPTRKSSTFNSLAGASAKSELIVTLLWQFLDSLHCFGQ
jgi:hypothetical protein